jgi:hypothetical protein
MMPSALRRLVTDRIWPDSSLRPRNGEWREKRDKALPTACPFFVSWQAAGEHVLYIIMVGGETIVLTACRQHKAVEKLLKNLQARLCWLQKNKK